MRVTLPFVLALAGTMTAISGCGERPPLAPEMEPETPVLTLRGRLVTRWSPGRPEIRRELVQGSRNEDGSCHFAQEIRLGPDEKSRLDAVVEHDPMSCRFIVATLDQTGYVPPGAGPFRASPEPGPAKTEGMDSYQTSNEVVIPGGGGAGGPNPIAGYDGSQCAARVGEFRYPYQKIITEDPVQINTSALSNFVTYTFDNGCVNWVGSLLLSEWFTASNWIRSAHFHDTPFPTYSDWRAVRALGGASFYNPSFSTSILGTLMQLGLGTCQEGGTTYASYVNYVDAWNDGYAAFGRSYDVHGGCSEHLHTTIYTHLGLW